jgi:Zn-dependent protease/CBS domain-containing protein
MFGKRVRLFNLFGFEVRLDASWLIIAILVTWSLASGLFPYLYPGLTQETYWIMAVVGALGLFISIIIHEFSHSLVARRFGMPMKGITLFIFGGVAEMGEEPPTAKAEFLMAIAGPVTSLVLAALFLLVYRVGVQMDWQEPVKAVFYYLASINGLLAAFNLLPAFPLDGGRVLRAILWGVKGDLRWATKVAANLGSLLGTGLLVLGIVKFLGGNLVGGLWLALIALFLRHAAQTSYQQLLVRKALEGETVRRFMVANPITVPPELTVRQLVEDYILTYHHRMYPVLEGEQLLGLVSTRQVREVPREIWDQQLVRDILLSVSPGNSIAPNTDAVQALAKMNQTGFSRLLVVDHGRLAGLLTLKDLLNFFSLKVELT